ncbi:MAG: 50S ribosomal protein L10 [Deltaproteobacteria bacterium]|nr:50S ribosomal protein L10 [Deltaproteobacteria bacterium]
MRLQEKEQIVQALIEKFEQAKVVIATDYKGLDVGAITALRRKLREAGCEYQVVKNTLLIRASNDTDVAVIQDFFKGPTAIAMNFEDPVAPAKVLAEFAKENNKFEIKAGAMSGKLLDLDAIKALSVLPSREVLLSQVLSAMNGVPTAFVRVLSGVPTNFLNVLQAIKDQKEAA